MNIKTSLAKSLSNPVAQHFVALLNKQEKDFRTCLTGAYKDRFNSKQILQTNQFTGIFEDYLRESISDDVLKHYESRPTLVFSTEVALTKEQTNALKILSGWNVYAMVYNLEDRCCAVLIKNHHAGVKVQNSSVEVQKWGLVYPSGAIKTSTRLPVASCGKWGNSRKLKTLPKEASKFVKSKALLAGKVAEGVKAGLFSISTK